jgi:hypothetical protein
MQMELIRNQNDLDKHFARYTPAWPKISVYDPELPCYVTTRIDSCGYYYHSFYSYNDMKDFLADMMPYRVKKTKRKGGIK